MPEIHITSNLRLVFVDLKVLGLRGVLFPLPTLPMAIFGRIFAFRPDPRRLFIRENSSSYAFRACAVFCNRERAWPKKVLK